MGAIAGLSSGAISLYITYTLLRFNAQSSAAVVTICTLGAVALVATGLSSLTRSRAVLSNLSFSCGLVVLSLLFFSFCMAVGAVIAAFVLSVGL